MKSRFRHIVFVAFFFFAFTKVYAQLTATFTITGSEASPQILTLKMYSKGFMLLGTTDGLYRFDGASFASYSFSKNIRNKAITALAEDSKSLVLIGFQNGEIGFVKNNIVQLLEAEEGHPAVAITAIVTDSLGIVYFATAGEGIYYYYNKKFYNINNDDGLSDNYVYNIFLSNGKLWANTDRGINCITTAGRQMQIKTFTSADDLPDNIVRCFLPSANGYWLGMQDHGIGFYQPNADTKDALAIYSNWKYGQVNSLLTSGKQLWAATEDSGIVKMNISNTGILESAAEKVLGGYVKTANLLQDNDGNIWFTAKEKLVRTNGTHFQTIISLNKKAFAEAHTLLADSKGNLWLNHSNGLRKLTYNPAVHSWQSVEYLTGIINNRTDITALYEDHFGNIWIGTLGAGIVVLNPATNKQRLLNEFSIATYKNILSISGKGNEIWLTTLSGILHCNLGEENSDITRPYFFVKLPTIGNIGTAYIYSTFIDSRGRVWFATDGHGISVYDHGFFKNYNQQHGIESLVIYNICEDRQGNIWCSALGKGLYKFDGKHFTNISTTEGLNDATVTALAVDKNNNIIAVTRNGINIINATTLQVNYIDKSQGLDKINTDLNCISVMGEDIFVVTNAGVAKYTASATNAGPATILEEVKVFSNGTDISHPGNFSYDENNFTFYYSGISFSHPEKIVYRYKIDDGTLNSKWILTKDNSVNIPKLPPGNYVFRVSSSINGSFISVGEVSYNFAIHKPFWLQWWFVLLVLLVMIGSLYLLITQREKRLQRLERLEKEKVQSQLEALKSQVNPHFLFNSFNTLIAVIEEDQHLAVEYVEHLSDFYRHIVMYRDREIVAIKEELDIISSYLFIQQKRFGRNLRFSSSLSYHEQTNYFIAPLTLQLLVENAIKHNAISVETPLNIEVYIHNEYLIAVNNINSKLTKENSAGLGLQNIKNRYSLLTNLPVVIEQSINNFSIKIPLLKQV